MPATHQRLYINVDHIATLRQARRAEEPDPVEAARLCELAGAEGITAHLREDRRHIQDRDVESIAERVRTVFNLEMALTDEMLSIAERLRPYQVTLVPERREEITTEGGLDVTRDPDALRRGVERLKRAGCHTSLFIDPTADAVRLSHELGADAIELHTGRYSRAPGDAARAQELRAAAGVGRSLGLAVHAGHGLTVTNVGAVAEIAEIEELNIGHHVVSRAVFIGIEAAVREMRAAIDTGRSRAR
jgi:pyridoxine 5-phosphate synthase